MGISQQINFKLSPQDSQLPLSLLLAALCHVSSQRDLQCLKDNPWQLVQSVAV